MHHVNAHLRTLLSHRSRRMPLALLLVLTLLLPVVALAASPGDLGDAPDSSNHFGVAMNAFPGVFARYPTVFDPVLGAPQGPLHVNPLGNGWLGANVSRETDADQGPDADGPTNIDPTINAPNRDRYDDGVPPASPSINLPQCGYAQFRYIVTGAAAVPVPQNYVNVWIDFNRDGDWADTLSCTTGSGAVLVAREWAVQNQLVNVVPGSVFWSTPVFVSFHTGSTPDSWLRINIAELKAPLPPTGGPADGRGPGNGYRYGETEDYFLKYSGSGTTFFPN